MLIIRVLPLFSSLLVLSIGASSIKKREDEPVPEDRHDLSDYCEQISQFSGEHYCEIYDKCCCPEHQNSALYCTERELVCNYDNSTQTVTEKKCVLSGCYYPTTPPEVTTIIETEMVDRMNGTIDPNPSNASEPSNDETLSEILSTLPIPEETETTASADTNQNLEPSETTTAQIEGEADPNLPSGEIPPEPQARPDGGNGTEPTAEEVDDNMAPGSALPLIAASLACLLLVLPHFN